MLSWSDQTVGPTTDLNSQPVEKMQETNRGVTLIAEGLTYTIRVKKTKEVKVILDDIHFITRPGELMAIMGPSGSGKTTFLNALAGRLKSGKNTTLSGGIYCDGNPTSESIKRCSNYVMQQDYLLDFLTVKETLNFAARLRLRHMTAAERAERVGRVMQELGLNSCQNVPVGGEQKKGLSGGQKKRVSIAIEMLDDPRLLFLDEPTSGLDSSLAHDVLKVLVRLAKSGRTVICTVHQPRSQVFSLFDQLLLLSQGRTVYQGLAVNAQEYFTSIGHVCPTTFNPADFFLDLLSADNSAPPPEDQELEDLSRKNSQLTDIVRKCSSSSMVLGRVYIAKEEIEKLPDTFKDSALGKAIDTKIEEDLLCQKAIPTTRQFRLGNYFSLSNYVHWLSSYGTLAHRTFLNNVRNPMTTIAQLTVNVFFGLLMGGIFFQLPKGGDTAKATQNAAQNVLGYLFFITAQYMFSNMDSLLAFPRERILFNRDTANGIYAPSAFFFAKMTGDFLFQQISPLVFSIIAYLMAGLGGTAEQFFTFLVLSQVAIFASSSYCYMIGAAVARFEIANIIAPVGGVVFMLLTGFYLKDDDIPKWISWSRYLIFLRYSFFSFVQCEFRQGEVLGSGAGQLSTDYVLRSLAGVPATPSLWINTLISFGLGCLYRVLAFLGLKFLNRGLGVEA